MSNEPTKRHANSDDQPKKLSRISNPIPTYTNTIISPNSTRKLIGVFFSLFSFDSIILRYCFVLLDLVTYNRFKRIYKNNKKHCKSTRFFKILTIKFVKKAQPPYLAKFASRKKRKRPHPTMQPLEPEAGLEPATFSLRMKCSTD